MRAIARAPVEAVEGAGAIGEARGVAGRVTAVAGAGAIGEARGVAGRVTAVAGAIAFAGFGSRRAHRSPPWCGSAAPRATIRLRLYSPILVDPAVPPRAPRLVTRSFVLVTVAVFLGALSPNLFVLASRYLARRGYDPDAIGLVMAAFMVGSLSTMAWVGRVIQRGHRALALAAGCAVGAAGCALFERADALWGFVAARVVQGSGFAAVLVSGSAYVAEIAPPARLAQALGFAGVLTLAAQAVGPAFGEWIVAAAGWRWLFWSGSIAGVAGAALGALLPPIRDGQRAGAAAPPAARATAAVVAMALSGFGFGSVVGFLAAYADAASVGAVSPFFTAYVAAAIAARLALGHLADTRGRRATATPALVGHSMALAVLAALSSPWQLVASGGLYGLCHGIYYPSLQAQIVERAPADARARAVATSTLAFGGGAFCAQLGLGVVANAWGYPAIYAIAAAAGVAAAGAVWSGPRDFV
ncbi:MAG: MFS transporter [Deltaproteobacteria bacterium]|nr:MAG: MFS transporter [Deltaproteobacteria bacterium]